MDELTWTPITVRLSALDFWERNPKRLTKAQAKRLADSTDRLGRAGVLLVGPQDARGHYPLYDGHQRANIWRTLYGADAEVHALQSNRELSEDERLSVSVLTVTAVGSLDFDALAGWDTGVLQDLGLGVDYKRELDDAAANIAAMLEALRAEEEAPDFNESVGLIGIKHQKWSMRKGIGFLSVRTFTAGIKKQEIEILKSIKRDKSILETDAIAQEISDMLRKTFISFPGFVVTAAPAHKTGFSAFLAQKVAENLGLQFVEMFFQQQDSEAKRDIFGDRPEISCTPVDKSIIWIDDTVTTGRTLEACISKIKGFSAIPIVWIYGELVQQEQ